MPVGVPAAPALTVSAEELLAGSELTFEIEIPPQVLRPGAASSESGKVIRLRPLTVRDLQLIARGAKNDEVSTSAWMIHQAAVDPAIRPEDVVRMHSGLVQFLVEQINRISGLTSTDEELRSFVESPLAQAVFRLAQEFHWTPKQVGELTVGQLLGYLEMARRRSLQESPA
jgi:hypothetical protein